MTRTIAPFCWLAATAFALGGAGAGPQPPDAAGDAVRVRLDAARAAYDAGVEKVRAGVGAWLDRREEAARRDGDKALVDQVKAERAAFDAGPDLPTGAPEGLRRKLSSLRGGMEAAYLSAVREYTRARRDDAAAGVERELADFRARNRPPQPARTRWAESDKFWFERTKDGDWLERSPDRGGTYYTFREVERTAEYVELYDARRKIGIRLYATSCEMKTPRSGWEPHLKGGWRDK